MSRLTITQRAVEAVADDWDPTHLVVQASGKVLVYLNEAAIPADRLAVWDQATLVKLRDVVGVASAAAQLTAAARTAARNATTAQRATRTTHLAGRS